MCDRRSDSDVTIRDLKVLVVVWSANKTCFVRESGREVCWL
jgi:hypothetical protein